MFFFFTCGTHTFTNRLKEAGDLTVQCQNCGNMSGHVYKRWEWFTFCFIPVIPFSLKPWKEVGCGICNFFQDIKYRPDVLNSLGHGQNAQGYAMGPPPQGHGGMPPQGHHPGQGQFK
ncbi:hypothetical protein M011DRAFT_523229 [Sporormia fimetaria CBS 119925]|uniref:Zinc-ribbon 15 domain-containing protein n=1 Tax=Sporormia fimetaria CBS 119925 TaxID=1340428 RepID=A0A6A6VM01_9PLEO|nr:hypothetical protein M011DRAFT_523229 [Sporormia fimetaria CBS 119925]